MVMFVKLVCVCVCFTATLGGITAKCRDEDAKFFSLCPEPEVSATVGEKLTLSCARKGEIQGCYWYYRRGVHDTLTPVNQRIQAVGEECVLHLSTDVESTGLYQCMPHVTGDSNPAPLVETKLTVYRPPDLIGLPKYDNNIIRLKEGTRNDLKCRTRNGTPPPRFSWFIGYQDVTTYAEEDDNMSTLKLHKVKELNEYHTKMLICQVNHPTLDAPATFNASLDILYQPKLVGASLTYAASALGGHLNIPFEVTTNPELSINDYILVVENPHGLVKHKLRAGEQTFSKTYSVSLPERVKGTNKSRWRFYVSVSSVTEEVLNNIHHIRLTNTEGMQSKPFSFTIRLKTDITKLAALLAVFGIGVLLVLCVMVSVIKKRNDRKREEAWKLWTSEEKLSRRRWDTLPYVPDDHIDPHSEKKHSVVEELGNTAASESDDDTSRGAHTSRSDDSVMSCNDAGSAASNRTVTSLNNKHNSSILRSALQCVI